MKIILRKENAATYNASIAIDDFSFTENCAIPEPHDGDTCPEGEWMCDNKVKLSYLLLKITNKRF